MALAPIPENFRAEMARFKLTRQDVARHVGMTPNSITDYLRGHRPMQKWAAHNIGYGINMAAKLHLIDVDMEIGPMPRPRSRHHPRAAYMQSFEPARRKARRYGRRTSTPS